MVDDFETNKKAFEENKQKNKQRFEQRSKKHLFESVKQKIKTTMIGSLAEFEQAFGYLWGFGSSNPTPQQRQLKELWERTRTNILNNGNNQIRNIEQEMALYDITRKKEEITFIFKQEKNNG